MVGGGPAGSTAAIFLARNGFDVKLYEQDLKREKPCGGGLSWRVIKEFKEFTENLPHFPVKSVVFVFDGDEFEVRFARNVGIVTSRFAFDTGLRKIAKEEGAKLINKKVEPTRLNDEFVLDARGCGGCINPTVLLKCDCEKRNQKMLFEFKTDFTKRGYFWVFPVSDNLVNVGFGSVIKDLKIKPMEALNWFLKKMDLKISSKITAAHMNADGKIDNLIENNVIKLGERAGLVNPATAEGIYYAMRSGKIVADCIIEGNILRYEELIKKEFGKEFEISRIGVSLAKYLPSLLLKAIFKFGVYHVKSKVDENSSRII